MSKTETILQGEFNNNAKFYVNIPDNDTGRNKTILNTDTDICSTPSSQIIYVTLFLTFLKKKITCT